MTRVLRRQPKRGKGWLRDRPDIRDVKFTGTAGIAMPPSVDLRPYRTAVLDQGQASSCTAHAWACLFDVTETKAGLPRQPISRLFIYYGSRALEGTSVSDSGAWLRDGARSNQLIGVPPETFWPYDLSKLNKQPGAGAYMAAHPRREGVYERIADFGALRVSKIKSALSMGMPVVFGTQLAAPFEDWTGPRVIQRPADSEELIGGHAMCIVGYDSDGFIVANSWGREWRDDGYCWFTPEYITWMNSNDFWICRDWRAVRHPKPLAVMRHEQEVSP